MGDGHSKNGKAIIYTRVSTIIHVFSCKIYGLRKYKKQIREDVEIVKEL